MNEKDLMPIEHHTVYVKKEITKYTIILEAPKVGIKI